jgi:putative CocE/NonD family hydrolase
MSKWIPVLAFTLLCPAACCAGSTEPQWSTPEKYPAIDFGWGVKIPMRDGVRLNATLYRPANQAAPLPCIFTLTPYISQTYHDRGMYFAAHGYVFLTVDARGRGNSEGKFTPLLQEANDGPQVVEWLARQPYCNGEVAMWGGSYAGYDQWATAKEFPAHLTTIVPVASPRPGVDFPALYNIHYAYDIQWIALTSGRTSQENIFADDGFWRQKFGEMYLNHRPFRALDSLAGVRSQSFQTWLAHPTADSYWDAYDPTPQQFAKIDLPILTITGQYDGDQAGALSFYREHLKGASPAGRAKHYLIIGPWDHYGTRTPDPEYGGIEFGKASIVDLNRIQKEWYDWTMKDGDRPAFLQNKVAYYLFGGTVGQWRYARSLDAVTSEMRPMYLTSTNGNANSIFIAGTLTPHKQVNTAEPDHYVYDPLDVRSPTWNPEGDEANPNFLTSVRGLLASSGKLLIYHSPAFTRDIDLAGFFKLSAWIALDQPDTDIAVAVYAVMPDGHSELLTVDMLRARYRNSFRKATFVKPGAIERYDFDRFTFIARHLGKGSRLRLVIGPLNSRDWEKNYNSDGVVADESGKDARTVTVTLYHDARHPTVLYLPIAAKSDLAR